jgi:hypothetical protein
MSNFAIFQRSFIISVHLTYVRTFTCVFEKIFIYLIMNPKVKARERERFIIKLYLSKIGFSGKGIFLWRGSI